MKKPFTIRGVSFTADEVQSLQWLTDTITTRPDGSLTYLYQLRLSNGRTMVLSYKEGYALERKLKTAKK